MPIKPVLRKPVKPKKAIKAIPKAKFDLAKDRHILDKYIMKLSKSSPVIRKNYVKMILTLKTANEEISSLKQKINEEHAHNSVVLSALKEAELAKSNFLEDFETFAKKAKTSIEHNYPILSMDFYEIDRTTNTYINKRNLLLTQLANAKAPTNFSKISKSDRRH